MKTLLCQELYHERTKYDAWINLLALSLSFYQKPLYILCVQQGEGEIEGQALNGVHSNGEAIRRCAMLYANIEKTARRRMAISMAQETGEWLYCPVCSAPLKYIGDELWAFLDPHGEPVCLGQVYEASCPWCGEGGLTLERLQHEPRMPSFFNP